MTMDFSLADTSDTIDRLFAGDSSDADAVARIHNWVSQQSYEDGGDSPEDQFFEVPLPPSLRDSCILSPDLADGFGLAYDDEEEDEKLAFPRPPPLLSSPSCPNLTQMSPELLKERENEEWRQRMFLRTVGGRDSSDSSRRLRVDKPLPRPPRATPRHLDLELDQVPFAPFPPSPTSTTHSAVSHPPSPITPPPHSVRFSRASRFPSISTTLSRESDRERRQAMFIDPALIPEEDDFATGGCTSASTSAPFVLSDTLPLKLKKHNGTSTTLAVIPGHQPPSPTSTIRTRTPALTECDSSPASTSSSRRAPRPVPSALSLFHLPQRSNPTPTSFSTAPAASRGHRAGTPSTSSRFSVSESDLTLNNDADYARSLPSSPASSQFTQFKEGKQKRVMSLPHFGTKVTTGLKKGGGFGRSALGNLVHDAAVWKKKKLVVSGVDVTSERACKSVMAWCESHGEVSKFAWQQDALHVHYKKASVAETVCRLQAQVNIKGAGSVSLSWYSGKKRP